MEETERKIVEIFSNGICNENSGIGGWCAILRYNGIEKEMHGGGVNTNQNRLQLYAMAQALLNLREPCNVILYSGSQYCINALLRGWAKKWKANGWMRNKQKKVLNPDLWEILLKLCEGHYITPVWVQPQSGQPDFERCSEIAAQMEEQYSYAACM